MSELIKRKKIYWEKLKPIIEKEVGEKYTVKALQLDTESIYFHPIIELGENERLFAQCDIERKELKYYALQYEFIFMEIKTEVDLSSYFASAIEEIETEEFKEKIAHFKAETSDLHEQLFFFKKQINNIEELLSLKKSMLKNS